MKKSETSNSWNELLKELQVRCQEQDIPLLALVGWIRDSINQIERATFDYYVTSGPIKGFPTEKVDIAILFGVFLYGFTVFKDKKEHIILPIKRFYQYKEEIIGDRFMTSLKFDSNNSWSMEDYLTNSAKLRAFGHEIMNRVWEK